MEAAQNHPEPFDHSGRPLPPAESWSHEPVRRRNPIQGTLYQERPSVIESFGECNRRRSCRCRFGVSFAGRPVSSCCLPIDPCSKLMDFAVFKQDPSRGGSSRGGSSGRVLLRLMHRTETPNPGRERMSSTVPWFCCCCRSCCQNVSGVLPSKAMQGHNTKGAVSSEQ